MSEDNWGHSFHLYILPEDLMKVQYALKQEGLYTYCFAYDIGSVAVGITYYILKENKMDQFCPFKTEVEQDGDLKGYYYLKFSWMGEQDASHIFNFLKKYNFGMQLLGYAGDWLGFPICLFYSQASREQAKQITLNLRKKK